MKIEISFITLDYQALEPAQAVGGFLGQQTPPQIHLVEPHPFLEVLGFLLHNNQELP